MSSGREIASRPFGVVWKMLVPDANPMSLSALACGCGRGATEDSGRS
jgi:hypothetical protein